VLEVEEQESLSLCSLAQVSASIRCGAVLRAPADVDLLALLCFLLELVEASLEPSKGLQEHVVIGYLVAGVGIGQERLEALPDRLDAGKLLIAELDGQLVGRLVRCLGHGRPSGRCG
jgi:hypothetical protein